MLHFGHHAQLSVFECLLEQKQVERMKAGILRLIADEEDAVRIDRLCTTSQEKVELLALGCLFR